MLAQFGIDPNAVINEDYHNIPYFQLKDKLLNHVKYVYDEKEKIVGGEQLRELERIIMLQIMDSQWKDNLLNIDHLKEGIGLRGYAQKDPLVEYKKESFFLFDALRQRVDEEVIRFLFLFRPIREEEEIDALRQKKHIKLSKPTSKLPGKRHRGKH
jgi:preprotein translocase subunit SecA